MPLAKGSSQSAISKNIGTLRREGKPEKQAVAIAERVAGKARHAAAAAPAAPGGGNTFMPGLEQGRKRYEADGWVVVEEVPIFDAHDGAEEGLDVDFDEELLRRIVEACNARIRDTGDRVPVTDGHTSDDRDPDVLGWADQFALGQIGRERPRACITCRMCFRQEDWERARKLPRRSVELWPDQVVDPIALTDDRSPVDSVALLGSERPARDLGVMSFSAGARRYRRSCYEEDRVELAEIIKAVTEALQAMPEWAYLRECMAKSEAEAANPEAAAAADQEQAAADEEKAAADEAEAFEADEKVGDDVAGGDSEQESDEKDEDEKMGPAKLRMQRDQMRRKYAKLEAELQAQRAETAKFAAKFAEMELEKRTSQRRADLIQLEAEGYDFDAAEELDAVRLLEPVAYAKHMARARKLYRKAPVGVRIVPAPLPAEGGSGERQPTPDQVYQKAIAAAREKYKS